MGDRDSWHLREGDQITPELAVLHKLGGGSAYQVHLAFDEVTYSPVVVKLVRPSQVTDSRTLRGLRREVDLLQRMQHPALVRSLRAVLDGERPHVVLEQLDGPRLSTLVRRYGALEPQQYLPMGIEIAAALHYLHGQGVVHLDVKPSNIIMGAPAKLIDLSIARSVERATDMGYVVGTDRYMAPEQSRGHPEPASDVWGLGATLYEAAAGSRAFADPSDDDRFPQRTQEPYALPERVPDDLTKLVLAMMDRSPLNRPSPAEVADALGPMLERTPRGRLAGFKIGAR